MDSRYRFTYGFIAGLIGGVVKMLLNFFSFYILRFAKDRYLGLFSIILHGRKPEILWEAIFSQIAEIIFAGLMGVIFIYLIPQIRSAHLLLKG